MYNDLFAPARTIDRVRSVSSRPFNNYSGANLDRRTRYDARALRRGGDWGVLNFPSAVLWFDPFYAPLIEFGVEPVVPLVIDIWGD